MIPVSRPHISSLEQEYVNDAVRSGWVSSIGPYVDRFEKCFAEYCGTSYAVTVSNGTVGLHLALVACGIRPGDEVIVPDLTFVATANAVRMAQAIPVIVDVDRDTYCVNPEKILRAINSRTRAIIPVHLYGHPASMRSIREIASRYGVKVIEDAAEAHGAEVDGVKVGALADCAVFSFYGNKIITTGEGGMITTDNVELYQRVRHLRDHAMSKDVKYWHSEIGYNYRMTNIQAALGLAQLEQIEYFLSCRDAQLQQYRSFLEPLGVECNPCVNSQPVNWITCALVDGLGRARRDKAIALLRESGVDSRPFFFPLSKLPMYASYDNPVATYLSENGLNLPTFVGQTPDEIQRVCSAFSNAIEAVLRV
jgi:perosamine synthetase